MKGAAIFGLAIVAAAVALSSQLGGVVLLIPVAVGLVAYAAIEVRKSGATGAEPAMSTGGSATWAVVRALGRAEGRRLLRSPTFWVGMGFSALATFAITGGGFVVFHREGATLTLLMFPFAGMVLIALNLATLRSSRDDVDETFDPLPVGRDARTLAHLLSVSYAVAAALVWVALQVGLGYLPVLQGGLSRPDVAELLTGPLLVGCAGVVGVSAARLVPSAVVGPVAVVAMGVFQGSIDHFAGSGAEPNNWFAPWVPTPEFWASGDLLSRRAGPHLVYLAGLGTFAAVVGFLRHRRDKPVFVALGVAFALIAAGGFVQSRPYPASEWDYIAAVYREPDRFQTCEVRAGVTYCAFHRFEPLISHWAEPVEGVLRATPDPVRARGLEVRQRFGGIGPAAPPQLRVRLPADFPDRYGEVFPDDGAIHPTGSWCGARSYSCDLALGVLAGAWAVGLPLGAEQGLPEHQPDDPYAEPTLERYDATGEARAIVAVWLGARSNARARAHFLRRLEHPRPPEQLDLGEPALGEPVEIEGCEAVDATGTMYDPGDLIYASRLLALPDAEVGETLVRRWSELTDPSTPSSVIADLFELGPPGELPGVFQSC